jgi:ribosomal protein L11 methylase PrmA
MNAVSRKNLTDARAVNANDVSTALDTGAAFGGVTGIAPSHRMIVTCMWGVSDLLRAGRGAKKGAAKWGSLTPHWALC